MSGPADCLQKTNPLQYHCTVLGVLWPAPDDDAAKPEQGKVKSGSDLGELLAKTVNRAVGSVPLFRYQLIEAPASTEDGLRDYLGELIELLLDEQRAKAAGMDMGFRKTLLDDLQKLINDKKKLTDMAVHEAK